MHPTTSIKIVFRPSLKNKNVGNLHVRTITNRKAKFRGLGIQLNKIHWDDAGQTVLPSLKKHYRDYNQKIAEVIKELRDNDSNIEVLKADTAILLHYWYNHIITISNPTTAANQLTAYNTFKLFLISTKSENLKISQLNPTIVKHYQAHLLKDKENSTVKVYLACLKAIVNQAIREQIVTYKVHPFINISTSPSKRKKAKSLDINQIQSFMRVELPENENYYRNMFLFSLFAGGLRIRDLVLLKWQNVIFKDGSIYLNYIQRKTGKHFNSKLSFKALTFLSCALDHTKKEYLEQFQDYIQDINSQVEIIKRLEKYPRFYENNEDNLVAFDDDTVTSFYDVELGEMVTTKLSHEQQQNGFKRDVETRIHYLKDSTYNLLRTIISDYPPQQMIFKIFKKELPTIQKTKQEKNEILNATTKVNRYLKKICVKAEVPVISSHSARHSYAQLLVNENVNVHHVQMLLGHSSLNITQNYIQSLHTSHLDHINDNLANMF